MKGGEGGRKGGERQGRKEERGMGIALATSIKEKNIRLVSTEYRDVL